MRRQPVKGMKDRDLRVLRREFSSGETVEDLDYIAYILTNRDKK